MEKYNGVKKMNASNIYLLPTELNTRGFGHEERYDETMSEGWWWDFQSVPLIYVMRLFLEEAHTVLSELQFPSSRRLRPIKP